MKILPTLLVLIYLLLTFGRPLYASYDPLSVDNNRIGIHILFTQELEEAARLINTSGGDWGYVTIPIQSGDKNIEKWQKFMDSAKQNHVIPIIRLSTEGDYFNTKVWRKPKFEDVLDFANFLNSLHWPTKNRYIMVYNEPNRGDEWGGIPDPSEYAQILSYATTVFKSKSSDFFIISAGLDNAAATVLLRSYDAYDFLSLMNNHVPGIFLQIDGISSHSYPNPAFAQPPTKQDMHSIASFVHEQSFIESLTGKKLPVFITETGWSKDRLSDDTIANYYKQALETIWRNDQIVAITPFLFRSGAGLFVEFSFINTDGSKSQTYKTYENFPKIQGKPLPPDNILGSTSKEIKNRHIESFDQNSVTHVSEAALPKAIKIYFKWLFKIE